LSRGGRLTLLKSTLCSLPIYFMSLFIIPASIANTVEKIIRDFLWNCNDNGNGLHWLQWNEVCRLKKEGGLGIRPLRDMNDALKTKWLWRFAKEDDAMWKNVIKVKYGIDELGWWSKKSSYSHGVGCWKSILTSLERFKSLVHFEVKGGSRVLFWHDVWHGDRPLKTIFPDLFRMARLMYATVQEVISWNSHISHWNLTFVRNLNDWEDDSIYNLLAALAGKKVMSQGNDEIVWPLNSK